MADNKGNRFSTPASLIFSLVEAKLMSQIDIVPTTLGLLNFSYRSKFFGKDILMMERTRKGIYRNL
ncbi:MAG: hypothetical protein ACXU99_00720 [Thermodesulfobacteriota bacterium]